MSRTEYLLAGIFVFLWWMIRQLAGQSPVSFGDITNKPVFNAVNGSDAGEVGELIKEVVKPLISYDSARLRTFGLGPPDTLSEWEWVSDYSLANDGHSALPFWRRVP